MDFVFISMPYSKFDSKWFAHVPNINLGMVEAFLTNKGKRAKSFHFHLKFLAHLRGFDPEIRDNLVKLSDPFGVEYLGLDYLFASLLFEERYSLSRERFEERLHAIGLTLNDFEALREVARAFIEDVFSELLPYLEGTRLVGFSCSHYQLSGTLLMCSKIKNACPDTLTLVGGKDCSGAFAPELLSNTDLVDFVGIGECEVTIASVLDHVHDRKKPLYNVVYRDAGGGIGKSESKENLSLQSLPFPAYDLEDFSIEAQEVILPIELGRGCPWGKCTFCPDKSYNIRCQSKTAHQVTTEIEHYQQLSRDLRNFIILDSDALKIPKMIIELSKSLEGKGLSFHFAEFRAEKMGKKVLESLLRFGTWVSQFQVGIETFSDRVLKLMKKGVGALKNVEVLKMAAESGVPLQFNLFTCFPKMTTEDLMENLRVMDLITHLLVTKNISIHPAEFYLPTDCPIFENIGHYGLEKHSASIFSDIFEDFPMPSYSNYPYPYQFDNDEEQFEMSMMFRKKVEEIERKSPGENFIFYKRASKGLQIAACRDGRHVTHILTPGEEEVYLSAIEKVQRIRTLSKKLGVSSADLCSMLDAFEQKGLILYSSDRKSFLSLATRERH
ncbi:MAG: radical SAM protein [Thermodesulfobacteriota bacterium]|nr:radical SAM protein [Thermodesulfobacteriota bacterium]